MKANLIISLLAALFVSTVIQNASAAPVDSEISDDRFKASFSFQQSQDQCSELLQDCLSSKSKNLCLRESADNLFCKASMLGKLAEKRWRYASSPVKNKIADPECMQNFDNLLSARLIKGDLSPTQIEELSAHLETCMKDSPVDLNRQ